MHSNWVRIRDRCGAQVSLTVVSLDSVDFWCGAQVSLAVLSLPNLYADKAAANVTSGVLRFAFSAVRAG
jgi:hypothetical protein